MDTREFQTTQVTSQFEGLFKAAFPNGCSKKQLADCLIFFLAGYTVSIIDHTKAFAKIETFDGAMAFMDAIFDDTKDRGKHVTSCLISGDLSHEMFSLGVGPVQSGSLNLIPVTNNYNEQAIGYCKEDNGGLFLEFFEPLDPELLGKTSLGVAVVFNPKKSDKRLQVSGFAFVKP